MKRDRNITRADLATVRDVRQLLLAVLAVPAGPLEHAVQVAHGSTATQAGDPPELFEPEGVSRQALRMFWHFRCTLEAALAEERG